MNSTELLVNVTPSETRVALLEFTVANHLNYPEYTCQGIAPYSFEPSYDQFHRVAVSYVLIIRFVYLKIKSNLFYTQLSHLNKFSDKV